jgi:hypothetical protein
LIEPFLKKRKFPVERLTAKWHEDPARAFVLETQYESFNKCDTPVLANSTKARCDTLAITPILEHAAPELLALIADDVFWVDACTTDSSFEEMMNCFACRIASEYLKTHHASRVVVDDHRHPPAKRSALG